MNPWASRPQACVVYHEPKLAPPSRDQGICVISRMPLGLCNVGICILELVFIAEQHRQGVMDPKQLFAPVECGRDAKG